MRYSRKKKCAVRNWVVHGWVFRGLPENEITAIRAWIRLETDEIPPGYAKSYEYARAHMVNGKWVR